MLSVLIVNWNTRDLLCQCLASIQSFPPSCPHEVIVVDNCSDDGSAEAVKAQFPWVKLLASDSNLGYAAGNNLAFSEATGDYLLTLNPDTKFIDDSLDVSLESLLNNPSAGVLGPQLLGFDKKIQKSVRGFPTVVGIFGHWTKLDKLFPKGPLGSYSLPDFDYGSEGPAPQPMGTFLLFRRSALETVGDPKKPFDTQFPIFFNEVDLLYRLKLAGWACWYTPRARVLHLHGASTRQVRKSMVWESHNSLVRYMRKHLRWPARAWLPLIAAGAWVAALVRAKGVHAGFRA